MKILYNDRRAEKFFNSNTLTATFFLSDEREVTMNTRDQMNIRFAFAKNSLQQYRLSQYGHH